jgi:two-component system OmpR family response regulator
MRYLVIEDDENLAHLLQDGLQNSEITVELAFDGRAALKKLRNEKWDLAIVDVMIPHIDGLSLINTIRGEENLTPAIFLTAKDSLEDRVNGFQAGGDDYLVKPFSLIELQARINAVLRRVKAQVNEQYSLGDLIVDVREQKVTLTGEVVVLSQKEYTLLVLFLRNPNQLFDRNSILENVWGGSGFIDPNIVDQYVSYLRRKIDLASAPSLIETVRGQGYRLSPGSL